MSVGVQIITASWLFLLKILYSAARIANDFRVLVVIYLDVVHRSLSIICFCFVLVELYYFRLNCEMWCGHSRKDVRPTGDLITTCEPISYLFVYTSHRTMKLYETVFSSCICVNLVCEFSKARGNENVLLPMCIHIGLLVNRHYIFQMHKIRQKTRVNNFNSIDKLYTSLNR